MRFGNLPSTFERAFLIPKDVYFQALSNGMFSFQIQNFLAMLLGDDFVHALLMSNFLDI